MIAAEEFFRNKIKEQNPNREVVTLSQELITAEQGMRWANEFKQLHLHSVVKSLPDVDNYDYLRGFIDGYGGEEPHDVFPDGFKDINDVWDRMYELDCKNCEDDK